MIERMRELISEQLNCDAEMITPDTSFKDDLGADSLAAMELIMALEEKLDIEIDDAELDQFKTVNDLVSYLETKVQ